MTHKTLLMRSVFALAAAALVPQGAAFAQGASGSTLEEVVVTARKREGIWLGRRLVDQGAQ